jgi:hypothetical protein
VAYGAIGIVFALPRSHALGWRWAAWAVSGVIYICHIVYERYWLGARALRIAAHVTLAVALGAFLLAVGALVHAVLVPAHAPFGRLLIALVAFPVIATVPAFVVALVLALVLSLSPAKKAQRPGSKEART